jgi:plasmid maintenance system antidote protein VapI
MAPAKAGWKDSPIGGPTKGVGNSPTLSDGSGDSDIDNAESVPEKVKAYVHGKNAAGATFSVAEDVAAIFKGQNLSEDFKSRAKLVFEAAVISAATKVCEGIEADYASKLVQVSEQLKEDMATKLDAYLGYMTEQWLEQNNVAVEQSLRTEIAESFMTKLHKLMLEHWIDVPESKVDMVEELAEEIDELKGRLNESIETNLGLKKQLTEGVRVKIVESAVEGLNEAQSTKVRQLSESVQFKSTEDFTKAVKLIKETYAVPTVKVPNSPDVLNEDTSVEPKSDGPKQLVTEEKTTVPAGDDYSARLIADVVKRVGEIQGF